jgi:hypothetical protein
VQDGGATPLCGTSGVGEPPTERISVTREAGEGKVSVESIREAGVSALAFSGGVELASPAVAEDALHRKLGSSIASGGGQTYIAGGAGNENGNPGG